MKETKTIVNGIRCDGCGSQMVINVVVNHQEDVHAESVSLQCTDRECYYGSISGRISIASHATQIDK
jgi:hypothetical protein